MVGLKNKVFDPESFDFQPCKCSDPDRKVRRERSFVTDLQMIPTMRLIPLLFLLFIIPAIGQEFKPYDQEIPGTGVSFRMASVKGGSFTMGTPTSEYGRDLDEQEHVVEVSSFWMGATEVTFSEWDLYFNDMRYPQSKIIDGVTRATPQYIDLTWGMGRDPRHPANSMSQLAAVMYCKWLYEKTGIFYRLPTEAEWEYACRKGETGKAGIDLAGWHRQNGGGKFHKVGGKQANTLGIFDLLGNLSEWTLDQYDPAGYSTVAAKDPVVPPATKYPRVTRGGSYMDEVQQLRCGNRIPSAAAWNQRDPQIPKSKWWLTDGMFVGFRVVRPLRQPSAEEAIRFYDQYLK